jgi:hypothetical protein
MASASTSAALRGSLARTARPSSSTVSTSSWPHLQRRQRQQQRAFDKSNADTSLALVSNYSLHFNFHTSTRANAHFSFDTSSLVARLEKEGLTREQALGVMEALEEVIEESIHTMTANLVTRAEQEKHQYTQKVDFAKLKSEITLLEKQDFSLLKSENERLLSAFFQHNVYQSITDFPTQAKSKSLNSNSERILHVLKLV